MNFQLIIGITNSSTTKKVCFMILCININEILIIWVIFWKSAHKQLLDLGFRDNGKAKCQPEAGQAFTKVSKKF